MARLSAVYVEDEVGRAVDRFRSVLDSAGFQVTHCRTADEARVWVSAQQGQALIDLLVLDRKLPERDGGIALEKVGDDLFADLEKALPDVPIMVLTGYSDEDSVAMVLQRENSLDLGAEEAQQRVRHFRKGLPLPFRDSVKSVAEALGRTEAVAVEGDVRDVATRRLLKRVGQKYAASLVRAHPATGGLSDAPVWLCELSAHDGRRLASVVVKVAKVGEPVPKAGFMSSIPSLNAAHPRDVVAGACGGRVGHVAPLAGPTAQALMDIMVADVGRAAAVVPDVLSVLKGVSPYHGAPSLEVYVAPLIEWSSLEGLAGELGINLPPRNLPIPSMHGLIHGDLHPGNVLVVEGEIPVFIDFDRQRVGALLLDQITFALGAVFHRAGALRSHVPATEALWTILLGETGEGGPGEYEWFDATLVSWSNDGASTRRDKCAAVLAYAMRQLQYGDVREHDGCMRLALDLARLASRALIDD